MTAGSRPAAKLSWWLDNQALDASDDKVLGDGNVTTSTVSLTPTAALNGKALTCRAENPALPAGVEEDTWRLNVHFEPALRLQLGSNLNPDDIEEGDDVYFECKVTANPWAYKVVWKHNFEKLNEPILHSQSKTYHTLIKSKKNISMRQKGYFFLKTKLGYIPIMNEPMLLVQYLLTQQLNISYL
ncbi:GH18163 [Gryllus bimaculatus]|nr:GH18163 [Gryllus bimaculatus]